MVDFIMGKDVVMDKKKYFILLYKTKRIQKKNRKKSFLKSMLYAALAVLLFLQTIPAMSISAFAEEGDADKTRAELSMVEGDVRKGFVSAGAAATSSDASIAWVDRAGNLNAMKTGTAKITTDDAIYTVNVTDYIDGSDVVGQLKILARYNDSMQFYDGHVYLLFTSYKDDVEINVPDLYAAYEISDQYYADIREDISNGSNHKGKNTVDYFKLNTDLKAVTLDKGEIVTIGMYRAFDLSIEQTGLQMLQNSTLWTKLGDAEKTAVVKIIFGYLQNETIPEESVINDILAVFEETGLDYQKLLDGVTEGGVCFNRELYNQKLEWDQYENVTYEMDITENQLKLLVQGLQGNLNKFSLLKNSCASVALRAWNLAVGTRDGKDTSYKLDASGSGIFSYMDAPKGVRDNIVERLPGYYLNNAEGVAEPNAGFKDETGWVYVSAPETIELPAVEDVYLHAAVEQPDSAQTETKVWNEAGDVFNLDEAQKVATGTKLFVSAKVSENDRVSHLTDIVLNGKSILTDENYDVSKEAYSFTMPDRDAWLKVVYTQATVKATGQMLIQIPAGDTLKVTDYAKLQAADGDEIPDSLKWIIDDSGVSDPAAGDILEMDETSGDTILVAKKAGNAVVMIADSENENISAPIAVEVFDSRDDMAKITFEGGNEGDFVITNQTDEDRVLTFSGYVVKKGSVLSVTPAQTESKVISSLTANGKAVAPGERIIADGDTAIKVTFAKATITNVPRTIKLDAKGDTYQLDARVSCSGTIYDPSIHYVSPDSLIEVDESGLITVAGDVPEEGKAIIVTAYAGSGNNQVSADCKVIVGDYAGARIVGKLTIYARPILKNKLIAHGAVAFTSYDDMDLDVSYYNYYRPTDSFVDLVTDYDNNPQKYIADPALYNEQIDLSDRPSYFDEIHHGPGSEASTVTVKKGETITLSNYGYDATNLIVLQNVLESSTLSSFNEDARTLAEQIKLYTEGKEIDGPLTFDSLVNAFAAMYSYTLATGYNPADGRSEGGLDINREMYNQFRRDDSQMPNNYYTVELTADELAEMKKYISDPNNNYYSLFNKNCAVAARDIWNAALSDRPELQIKGDFTGITVDPQSLNYEIGALGKNVYEGDTAGTDFYPRSHYVFEAQEDEEPKTEDTSKSEDSVKTEDTSKSEDSAKTENTSKAEDGIKTEDTSKSKDGAKTEDTSKAENLSKTEEASNTDTVVQSGDSKTGDDSHLYLWMAVIASAVAGLGGLTVYCRKRR